MPPAGRTSGAPATAPAVTGPQRYGVAVYPTFSARAVGLNLSAEAAVALASSAGFAGVDLPVRDFILGGGDPEALRRRMSDLGLDRGTWPLPVHWRGGADEFARDLQQLPRFAGAAAALGLTRTGTWVAPETTERPESDAERGAHLAAVARQHVRRLGAIARVLDRFGIRLGLEVIGVESSRTGQGLPFLHRLSDFDRVLGAVWGEAPNLGIVLDSFHLVAAGEEIERGLAWGVEKIIIVHVAEVPASARVDRSTIRDRERSLPGEEGARESRALLARLARQGYDGPVTAEPLAGCRSLAGLSPEATARVVAGSLLAVWPSTDSSHPTPRPA